MTTPGIGGSGFIGVAIETTSGTYSPPTKFFPITSETLKQMQDTQYRTPIRHMVDILGAVQGDVHIEGDIVMEALVDVFPYFLDVSRCTLVKTGSSSPFTYTATPTAVALPTKTMSITIVRNGIVMGYVGCSVSQWKLEINNGILQVTWSMVGFNEATQSVPSDTYTNGVPFGEGMYDVELPTGTPVFDSDTFDFTVNDNGTPNYRMRSDTVGASFINWGERQVTFDYTRDFLSRADYDAYKALSVFGSTFKATQNANNSIAVTCPASIRDTHETNLDGQGNLIRSKIAYKSMWDAGTSRPYQIVVITTENMVP